MDSWATELVTRDASGNEDAAKEFAEVRLDWKNKKRVVPLILRPARSLLDYWLVIPDGFHAIVETHGKYAGIWEPGFHWAGMFTKVAYLVTKQYVVYDQPVKQCPTLDNVMVEIDISVVFHIIDDEESVKNFVYKLGPERLQHMMAAYQEEAARTMVRNKSYHNIYDLMETDEFAAPEEDEDEEKEELLAIAAEIAAKAPDHPSAPAGDMDAPQIELTPVVDPSAPMAASSSVANIAADKQAAAAAAAAALISAQPKADEDFDHHEQLEQTKNAMNEKLRKYGVEVYSITITNVHLPKAFADQMEAATTYVGKNAYAKIEQSFNLMVINHEEARSKLSQTLKEQRQEKDATFSTKEAEEKKELQRIQAETNVEVAILKEEHKARVLAIKTDAELKASKLQRQAQVVEARVLSNARAEAIQLSVEARAVANLEIAEAKRVAAANKAKTLLIQAEAEKVAASKLRSKRQYEAKMHQLKILKELAENESFTVMGRNSDSASAQLIGVKRGGGTVAINLQQ